MKIQVIILTIFLLVSFSLEAQKEDRIIIEKFITTKMLINGISTSELLPSYSILYKIKNREGLNMANISLKKNSESFGTIDSFTKRSTKDTSGNKVVVYEFNWHYKNSYDDVNGIAKVQIIKIFKQETVSTTVKMIPENLDILIYKGYIENRDNYLEEE